jgi:hypothetical protein
VNRSHLLRVALVLFLSGSAALPFALWLLPGTGYRPGARAENLARHLLLRHGVEVDARSILFPGSPGQVAARGALQPVEVYFLGRTRGERMRDLYFVHAILSDRGIPVHVSPAFSLSKTAAADEHELRYDGQRYLAFGSSVGGATSVVTILDLEGLSQGALGGFTRAQRLQQHLTNWQETGRWRGLDRIEVKLHLAQPVRLRFAGSKLVIEERLGRWRAEIDPRSARVLSGPAQARKVEVGKRSFLSWAVDTVRSFSFVGPERIAWLEEAVYGVVDRARRISGSQVTASEIKDEMALPVLAAHPLEGALKIPGWPPPPLPPILRGALKGEGQWTLVEGPFLRRRPGLPSSFAMSFVRPDAERLFARVYFVAWDARRLELRMVGGTAEPRSATGELGRGMIPRDGKLLPRVVAAFNGGFQSMHGDFGMMEERTLYAPPRPWGATVARLADGATGFGTWDGAMKGPVPEWIDSFRQNLTPFVEDGVYNPWKRGSWGGGAGFLTGSGPKAQIIRSGICLHKSGHVLYALGNPVDGPVLGKAMHKVGCDYAIQLDINSGHVGFELFNIVPETEQEPPGWREEKYFQRSGKYPGVEGLRYFMREVVRGTGNNPVPRYTGREARDFFYLVERELLPGPDLALSSTQDRGEGRWTRAALPEAALRFPPAATRTAISANPSIRDSRVHLVKFDMRFLEPTLCVPKPKESCLPAAGTAPESTPLALLPLGTFAAGRAISVEGKTVAGSSGASRWLVLRPRRPEGPALPELASLPRDAAGAISIQGAPASATAAGAAAAAAAGATAAGQLQAAVCSSGSEGILLYAAGLRASQAELERALTLAGCPRGAALPLGSAEPLLLGKEGQGASYQTFLGDVLPPVASTPSLLLRRSSASWAPRIFTHVKVQPRGIWTQGQPERTRASSLHHAKRTAESLGLPPLKSLEDLCREPWSEVKDLKQYRWRDPQTGRTCGGADPLPKKKKRRAKP